MAKKVIDKTDVSTTLKILRDKKTSTMSKNAAGSSLSLKKQQK